MNIPFLTNRSRKFLLSVGDDGAVLIYMVGGQMEGRFFFAEPESMELERVLSTDPEAPIYLFADISDQSYTQASLPPVSALNIQKLVARRLSKDFDKSDIKGALLIERSKTGRRDWNYIFVSVRNTPPFSLWLETLVRQQNRIAGIYLLPVEAEGFIRDVKKAIVAENVMKPSVWQMLITHNKVGGLRQVILKNGRIAFTRMAQPVGGTSPGVVAGNIEQEALNTIEFMRRLGYEPEEGLDIIIVTASEVKRQLEPSRFHATNVFVLTPHEIAGQLGLEKATEPKDKFADVVMLAYFGRHTRRILKLTTPLLTMLERFFYARIALKYLPIIFVPIAVILTAVNLYTGYSIQDDIQRSQDETLRATSTLKTVQARNDALAERKKQVGDLLSISDMLTQEAVAPFDFFERAATLKGPLVMANEVRYNVQQTTDKASKKTVNMIGINMAMEFPNRGFEPQVYLQQAQDFRKRFEQELSGMTVVVSGLPGDKDFSLSLGESPDAAGVEGQRPVTPEAAQPKRPQIPVARVVVSGPMTQEVQQRFFTLPEKQTQPQDKFVPVEGSAPQFPLNRPVVPPSIPPVGGKP